ncbi:hypothetical protein CHGG_09664 [Chaetomium globosum CBS 148.51]|uniref:DNA helicase Pif1-like 2B domain-containing protein n=1 Tax=Chaetomium globosum (strain ATCC 6205 / CBS 148.51 / DSM 1962 / NBRC 6347 / NRRL 1970) TaxID=306901 RepID=Q2GQU0_CHAGB|nr:uncharacterized protein CHGG_09664 [Chaetomium globosum CBS 148.51]EAQ83260.1 hypothetical protein CHGG_09664 [Chaetomium globosum CBS 148.51]
MAQMSASFGSNHHGLQVGYNYGSIEFPPPERRETPPIPFATIPFSRDPDFVNRGDILDQIDERCSELAGRVALVGLGGVGKSQLAIEYAHRIAAGHLDRWVFWVHAGTQARVEEGFRKIADNSRNGSIIITTRNKDLASRLTGRRQNIIEVGPMVQMDALTLLERKLGSILNTDAAAKLVRALDFIPLAISQAAAYIQARAPRSSLEKYLSECQESERKRSRLLEHDAGDLRRDGGASNAILTTWQISFDHIRSERPSAADLLSLMSFFDRQGIPESLLKSSKQTKTATRASGSEDAEDSGNPTAAMTRWTVGSKTMWQYYGTTTLIVVNEAGDQFEMHGLVQLSMRKWLETFRPAGDVQAAVHRANGSVIPDRGMLGKARNVRKKKLGAENMATLASISLFALVQMDRGQWEEAEKLFVQVMETSKTKLGADHPDTLTSMANLASTFWNQGRWEEAEKLFVQVMETSKTKLGADHPDTLTSMANLASTYRNQGRWEEAEKLDVQVMETRKTKLGADHPSTLTSMANLASTFWNQGQWEEAEKLEVQVMETSKTKLGADHPDTLTSMANLASTYRNQGRWEEAEKLDVQVMETSKTKLGADHPDTLTSMNNLAFTWKGRRYLRTYAPGSSYLSNDPVLTGYSGMRPLARADVSVPSWELLALRCSVKLSPEEVDSFADALRIYPTKTQVVEYNHQHMLGLDSPAIQVEAEHEGVGAEKVKSSNAGNLAKRLPLCVGCRVMLTRNLWADVGLVNGAQGTVYDISWKEDADVLRDPPEVIMVAFDDYDGPAFTMPNGEPLRSGEKLVVPILRVRQDFMVGANSCSREQFPLLVSYAITVHKSQGITLDKVVCDISAPEFASGLSYVAVSRVKTLGGLMFEKPFDRNRIYHETPSRAMGLKLSDHAIRQLQALDAVAGKDPSEESIGI